MAALPDFFLQVLWEGLVSGILYALIALGLRADLQGLGRVQLRARHHGRVRRPVAGRPARAGRAGVRGAGLVRADHAGPGPGGGAPGPAAARQPARHHPVHGDDRAHLLPDRPRRAGLRRRAQDDDHRRAPAADRLLRVADPGRRRDLPADRHRRRGDRRPDGGGLAPVLPARRGSAGPARRRRRPPGGPVGRHLARTRSGSSSGSRPGSWRSPPASCGGPARTSASRCRSSR